MRFEKYKKLIFRGMQCWGSGGDSHSKLILMWNSKLSDRQNLEPTEERTFHTAFSFLAYFPKADLCDLHAVCVSDSHPLLTFESLNQSL
jgi:hypothetical protein